MLLIDLNGRKLYTQFDRVLYIECYKIDYGIAGIGKLGDADQTQEKPGFTVFTFALVSSSEMATNSSKDFAGQPI